MHKKIKGCVMKNISKRIIAILLLASLPIIVSSSIFAEEKHQKEIDELQKKFTWWPTDALPAPVKDEVKGGYWWWPKQPGTVKTLWGNRGYCFVRKVIVDYKEDQLPPPQANEMRPSLLIKNIIKNVKIYFDYDKADIRDDAVIILAEAVRSLQKNPKADILITGNCDIRGSEAYNEKLGQRRGEVVREFMLNKGIPEERIRIVSRGKLDAVAHVTDLAGMQKDRNAQFMVAEVEEVMMPYQGPVPEGAKQVEEGKFVEEETQNVTGEVKVSTREYVVKKGDSLWKIAESQMGSGHRWKYLYQLNKDRIKNSKKLRTGTVILIPVE